MRLLVGLGNPGPRYVGTRHNLGFVAMDRIARESDAHWGQGPSSLVAEGTFEGQSIVLAKPLTYMNLSGRAVVELTRDRDIAAEDLLVFLDDVALPLGTLRLRPRGSDGGHRGLASVLEALHTEELPRVRLGIGPDEGSPGGSKPEDRDLAEFVLEPFSAQEQEVVEELLGRTVDAARALFRDGIERAMSLYNRAPEG
ncbi:MAG: aminoacyl-tRNA hydrolase [Vicinamibacteria bacterium]